MILGLVYCATVPAVFDFHKRKNKTRAIKKSLRKAGIKKVRLRRGVLISNLTEEEKTLRQVRNREHYLRYKSYKKKSIHEMTEEEKEKQRNIWRNSTRRCRQRKKDPTLKL